MQYKLQKQVRRRHGLDRKRFTFPPKLLIFSVSSLWQSLWGYTFKICYSENILGHYCISFQELLFWFMWHIDGGNPPYPCHAEGCVSSLLRLPRPEEAKNCTQPLSFFQNLCTTSSFVQEVYTNCQEFDRPMVFGKLPFFFQRGSILNLTLSKLPSQLGCNFQYIFSKPFICKIYIIESHLAICII